MTLLLTACYMPSAEIEYAISEDGSHAVVTGIGSSAKGRVVIADTYEGKYVTEIAEGAFAGCTALEILTVGTSLSTVGDRAFADCTALRQMSFPATLTSLGCGAFTGCTALTAVSF